MARFPGKLSALTASILLASLASTAMAQSIPDDWDAYWNNSINAEPSTDVKFPLPARATLKGATGSSTYGEGDAMLPVFGNPAGILFGDLTGKYGDSSSWLASAGIGGRQIFHNAIFGLYGFADFNRTPDSNDFWIFNPGIEGMTNEWDGHVNGYFSTGKKKDFEGYAFPTETGHPNFTQFQGHTQGAYLFEIDEAVGHGVDGQVGYTFNNYSRVRVFGGGYYFKVDQGTDIRGVSGGIIAPVSWNGLQAEIEDTYDNVNKNSFLISLNVTIGGLDKSGAAVLEDRMLDPIPRHMATHYTGDGIPTEKIYINTGRVTPELNNIYFFTTQGGTTFSPAAGTNNCTYEHPCTSASFNNADIADINTIAPGSNLYFTPGTYSGFGNAIAIRNGQALYGRTYDYTQPAPNNSRPVFVGTFNLAGNNFITNLNLSGTGTNQNVGIEAIGANTILINQVTVENFTGASQVVAGVGVSAIGINVENGTNIALNQVNVMNIKGGNGANGVSGTTGTPGTAGTAGYAGGFALGVRLNNVTRATLTNVNVANIYGGVGGVGGAGGSGTNASVNGLGLVGVTAGTGGNGGAGAAGGAGGLATGLSLIGTQAQVTGGSIVNVVGGYAGMGGAGGAGGAANASNGSVVGTASGLHGGTGGTGGNGGAGGAGNNGGAATAIGVGGGSNVGIQSVLVNTITGRGG